MTTSTMTVQQAVALARQYHQAGQLSKAESLYREVLAVEPNQPEAMHALGLLAYQSGMNDAALHFLRRAVAVNPMSSSTFADLGRVLAASGRRDEAVVAYRSALRLDPHSPQTHMHLANALLCLNILDEAITEYRQAIALKWDFSEAYNNLGHALRSQGKQEEAIASFRCALRIKPQLADAHYNLGLSLKQCDQVVEAIAEFRTAVECRSDYPEAWNNLGGALLEQKDIPASIDAFQRALALRPNFPESLTNLGNALRAIGQLDQSIASIQKALALKPEYPCGLNSLGCSLHSAGRFDEAIAAYSKAINLQPDWAMPHCNLAFTLLLKGDFHQGWPEHEWRLASKDLDGKQTFDLPLWDGSDLAGKRIVLHTEQGFGDAIQFCRYVSMVIAKGGRVVLRCQPELICLMKNLSGVEQVISNEAPLPADVDMHSPLLSLPMLFNTDLTSIPAAIPYLSASADHGLASRTTVQDIDTKVKVGLVWAGRATYANDRHRTLSLDAFSPLADVQGVSFISLQKGDPASQAVGTDTAKKMKLLDCDPDLQTFADTASLIDALDLVITVDTAVAHLAAAMGKQVWVLLPFVPDWRWMLNRNDSPWYPSMTLFRQPQIGDWKTPIDQATAALRRLVAGA